MPEITNETIIFFDAESEEFMHNLREEQYDTNEDYEAELYLNEEERL